MVFGAFNSIAFIWFLLGTWNLPRLFLIFTGKTRIGDRQQNFPVTTIIGCYYIKGFGGLFPVLRLDRREAKLHHFDCRHEFKPNLTGIPRRATPPGVGIILIECILSRVWGRIFWWSACSSVEDNRRYKIALNLLVQVTFRRNEN